ncbi:flagellin [Siccirubricoccus sp. KC 17139]|uniref:Flagellin n=1 Tax=Siccirubricoccus soli TaxID=2899147 RepID=A0ABT1D6Q7_9PROT|nr:flagellin [Siccirubricoccus soli]MCO6416685.1 flagellin [Siccirubricoccus soli]MCP2682820.1 flagellin [Siccirubricoccus soli]
MPLNSVNTNIGAKVALHSLNRTTTELEATQKRISTGYRVADAQDDGAAFAVAERVRGDIAATTSANEQLGGAKGLLDVSNAALENVSSSLQKLKTLTVKLADGTLTDDQRTQYQASVKEITNNIKSFINDASYNGTNITDGTKTSIDVITNGQGDRYTITGFDGLTSIFNAVSGFNAYTAGSAAAALTATGVLTNTIATTLTQLNNFGSYSNYIEAKIDYNKAKIDAQEGGLGALVDADLAKESAKLQALQIRQQLGTQALSIANQAPQTLLSLFR